MFNTTEYPFADGQYVCDICKLRLCINERTQDTRKWYIDKYLSIKKNIFPLITAASNEEGTNGKLADMLKNCIHEQDKLVAKRTGENKSRPESVNERTFNALNQWEC